MKVTLRTWGRSQGLVIPKKILNVLGIAPNSDLEMTLDGKKIILSKPAEKDEQD